MLGFNNIPDNDENFSVFLYPGSTLYQIWRKPKNASLIAFYCVGGGGGGTGGGSSAAGGTGGAGGGGGAYTFTFYPSFSIPDNLYVLVGKGGAGGAGSLDVAAGTSGSPGEISYVSLTQNIATSQNVIVRSGTAAAGGGTGTTGGTAGTAWTVSANLMSRYANSSTYSSQVGGAGGATPGSITPARMTTGGAGGGNGSSTTPLAGGSITGTGYVPTVSGGAATGQPGQTGFNSIELRNGILVSNNINGPEIGMIFTGGAGGGGTSIVGGDGGAGGNGAYGSGGGGGGGARYNSLTLSGRGGQGGNGGDGFVIIISR